MPGGLEVISKIRSHNLVSCPFDLIMGKIIVDNTRRGISYHRQNQPFTIEKFNHLYQLLPPDTKPRAGLSDLIRLFINYITADYFGNPGHS